jgi:hypothetical protein
MSTSTRGARALGTELEKVTREFLSRRVDVPLVELVIRDLRVAGKLARPALQREVVKLEALLQELPKLAETFAARRDTFAHLFGDGLKAARGDVLKRQYLTACDNLRELARSSEFQKLLQTPASRQRIEKYAQERMLSLAGVVDRYGDLYRETYTVNALTRRLYPGEAIEIGLRLDAQHIVEQRAFEVYKKDWALLGWESTLDMPALPIMHEWHIPSPKNLPGLNKPALVEELEKPIEDVFSLTKEMERDLKLEKFKSADQYLEALKDFYKLSIKNKRNQPVEPLNNLVKCVEQIQRELDRARTAAALVKATKLLRGK